MYSFPSADYILYELLQCWLCCLLFSLWIHGNGVSRAFLACWSQRPRCAVTMINRANSCPVYGQACDELFEGRGCAAPAMSPRLFCAFFLYILMRHKLLSRRIICQIYSSFFGHFTLQPYGNVIYHIAPLVHKPDSTLWSELNNYCQ